MTCLVVDLDFLATPNRRKVLFGLLYLSEGAPIGFIWLGLPTRLRSFDVPVDRITWLMALLILPWTLKFLWAPLIDLLRGTRWGLKHWILASQTMMAVALVPLFWLDLQSQLGVIAAWLLLHAFAAATQDISIDALCVQQSAPRERGSLNGWMQCGVLVGRSAMGGGSLILQQWIGFTGVIAALIGLVLFSAILLSLAHEKPRPVSVEPTQLGNTFFIRLQSMLRDLKVAFRSGPIWVGFLFALTAPAAFKSLEAIIGPYLIDHGYSEFQVGKFTATIMIGGMIAGSLLAGRLSARFSSLPFVIFALSVNLIAISSLAVWDILNDERQGVHIFVILTLVAISIGWFTVALYHWLMNLTDPRIAATQFTAFMAATNLCEAWSTSLLGTLQVRLGYPIAIMILCTISAAAIGVIVYVRRTS